MGVYQETGKPPPPNVTPKMARDRAGSDYSGHMSDTTTCSCVASSIDKCSLRGCGMFQEPFFLHPPGSRPRDGIYINPMSAYIGEPPKPKDTAESFYLHSPHDLVYTRITRLFGDAEKPRNGVAAEQRHTPERKDETLTVKVDVHINNGGGFVGRPHTGNGHAARSEIARESSDHAYEQICVRQEETSSVSSSSRKKPADNASDSSRSRKTDRRYSRSSSASESSNMSSEVHGLSSTTSTPSLSRHSSSERIGKPGIKTNAEAHERKDSSGAQVESEKEIRTNGNGGPSLLKPPPPPPPPPPDDDVVVVLVNAKPNADADKKDARGNSQDVRTESFAANKSDASSSGEHPQQPEVPAPASAPADADEIKASQASHLVNRHMVLPFIPPKFANADSNTLLKPSEYLKSICKVSAKNSLSKARSVDNLDIHSRNTEQGEEEEEEEEEADEEEGARRSSEEAKGSPTGPPPPPLSPLQQRARGGNQAPGNAGAGNETESSKSSPQQPLATISIQDLTSIQLRRTSTKMNATKTFSAPPPRSVSMTNVSEPFFVQKTDLIAELKRTKDIPGIKKLKVERAQVEKTQEQTLMSEISKAFSVTNFVDQIPEKDSSGNVIPIWKRQMLARKAAERAKKELEEQIARENEERRQKAIPPWKRQLLAKKDNEEKRLNPTQVTASTSTTTMKFEATSVNPKRDASPAAPSCVIKKEDKPEVDEKRDDPAKDDSDDGQIIPWRAQLRKTNSKLNILD
ncbi:nucleolar and coiled-body phosphoprotein 1-like [Temnothorax curvispinosus]|uniref:Nucleolar and coiled-body phosphoprotein 1-like n=1 Tax=Temnothorax curvispinosus TaxID=300111 RepID=A0A6J1QED5_9HYME|nr:nucleolar and coiled-body phosphoprotein 1-like [Temnothorax curvispinosus]